MLHCGLDRDFTLVEIIPPDTICEFQSASIGYVCSKCNFYAEGQEYWEKEYECGAYKFIKQLLIDKIITVEEIEEKFEEIDLNPGRELKK